MKRFFLIAIVFAICVSTMPLAKVNAQENSDEEKIEELINGIENIEGTEFDKVIIGKDYNDVTGMVDIAVDNLDGSFTVYTTISEKDKAFLMTNPTAKVISTYGIIRTAIGIIRAVYVAGKTVCKLIQHISGDNVCGTIGKQILNGMMKEKSYKATSQLKKDPSCVPSHSSMCNSAPYVYWETVLVPA